jgi:hypothetical protein
MVDSSYRCLAIRMADGLVSGLTGEKSDFPDKARSTN